MRSLVIIGVDGAGREAAQVFGGDQAAGGGARRYPRHAAVIAAFALQVEDLDVIRRTGLQADDRVVIVGLQRARPGRKVTAEPGEITTQSATTN